MHLKSDDILNHVPRYTWVGYNQKILHVNGRKGPGGFLIHSRVLNMYKLDSIDPPMDGIMKIVLSPHKQNEGKLLLFGCYIPPEHSSKDRVSHDVFSYLSCEIYGDIIDMNHIVICGDINARTGRLSDCIRKLDVSTGTNHVYL